MFPDFLVFGDSHSECFSLYFENVFSFSASSAKGLYNDNSILKTNRKIIDILKRCGNIKNCLFYFGKVDVDFILHYKYNIENYTDTELREYISKTVNFYVSFLKECIVDKNVYVCELTIPHNTDDEIKRITQNAQHFNNINNHLTKEDKYTKLTTIDYKPIEYKKRLEYYELFNTLLKENCEKYNFHFVEINKYFVDNCIPDKYISKKQLDHHLDKSISELYIESLKSFFVEIEKNIFCVN